MQDVKLTKYSHGAGCGCKIAPAILEEILDTSMDKKGFPNLLVGYQTKDDAAAYDLGNGDCVLSTTDFFMPIVDDPYTFGQIAAANSISDVYAMGGKPLMAISILGWPIELLSADIASQVLDGARSICNQANIPIAGGHSIDSPEPIFGLAVTGLAKKNQLKQNNKGEINCKIYLTKPLGIGIITTAQKRGLIENKDLEPAIEAMTTLNIIGSHISKLDYVPALTDVTGFGLLGHLSEICESSNISAKVNFDQVPLLSKTKKYLKLDCIPGGTYKNFASYGDKIGELSEEEKLILCDPQTSGGLLVMVKEDSCKEFEKMTQEFGLNLKPIGYTCPRSESSKLVEVI